MKKSYFSRPQERTLGENCALAANQSVDCRATILFTICLNSAKVWNREFNWPVFGVEMHKKSPNVFPICNYTMVMYEQYFSSHFVKNKSIIKWIHTLLNLCVKFFFYSRGYFLSFFSHVARNQLCFHVIFVRFFFVFFLPFPVSFCGTYLFSFSRDSLLVFFVFRSSFFLFLMFHLETSTASLWCNKVTSWEGMRTGYLKR